MVMVFPMTVENAVDTGVGTHVAIIFSLGHLLPPSSRFLEPINNRGGNQRSASRRGGRKGRTQARLLITRRVYESWGWYKVRRRRTTVDGGWKGKGQTGYVIIADVPAKGRRR